MNCDTYFLFCVEDFSGGGTHEAEASAHLQDGTGCCLRL